MKPQLRKFHAALVIVCISGFAGCKQRTYNAAQTESRTAAAASQASAAKFVANIIKQKISDASPEELTTQLKRQYVKLHFLDRSGNWLMPELKAISAKLLPPDFNLKTVFSMVDKISDNMEENPYMMDFLNAARDQSFPILKKKFATEGRKVLLEALTAAYAFEVFTEAELNDPKLIEAVLKFWPKERAAAGVSMEQTGLFGIVKLHSVELPIKKIVEFHNGKTLDPKFLRGFLSLNINEAIIADRVTKHHDNAAAGWPLTIHQAGDPENPKTGAGPATFSPDKKKIEIRYDLPKQWDDLYQVWNMAFVTQIPTYPLWISKLLIPQMSGYKDYPEQYIYRRTLSLYTALHYFNLSQIEDARDGIPKINWADDALTLLWGKINRRSAEDYEKQVKQAKSGQ